MPPDGQDGEPDYVEFWERFAVDFVREDGAWKIWHFQIHSDVMINIPDSMVGGPGSISQPQQAPGEVSTTALEGDQPSKGGGGESDRSPRQGSGVPPNGGMIGDTDGGQVPDMKNDMDRQVTMHEMYSATTVPQLSPRLPVPYDTWEDTTPYNE